MKLLVGHVEELSQAGDRIVVLLGEADGLEPCLLAYLEVVPAEDAGLFSEFSQL